ncbi:MAG: hypothetical protein A3G76_01985 [Acidobacteria bacterium RIFCSPLOWO2_12_FULL_65_11]|nr:MAG: hypothetical protein A3H95_12900 [Acidobacteria bacterium RIFCSPLOWO2_02_FULL_64_15]OFW28706.1 MAG: hypothetical protein A3G76_01985 [Acidobacteria bacterium RIFCSPLOWO2_12_FULL_65_11]
MNNFFGMNIFPGSDEIASLIVRIVLNLLFTTIVVRVVYFKLYQHRDYIFTYYLLNVVTFSFAFLLSNVPVNLGFGLGLFGIFGILRYRTEAIEVRNLTYLFVVIGIAILNALENEQISLVELLIVNSLIAGAVCVLEASPFSRREESHRVLYDRLDLLGPATAAEVLEDLRGRTRLPITRFEVGDVDLMRDTAEIAVYYPATGRRSSLKPKDAV